ANGVVCAGVEIVEVIGMGVVMEMGEKIAEKGVGKRAGNTVLCTVF
nr:hypothetical protein [Tanacetum cinerariifolium]